MTGRQPQSQTQDQQAMGETEAEGAARFPNRTWPKSWTPRDEPALLGGQTDGCETRETDIRPNRGNRFGQGLRERSRLRMRPLPRPQLPLPPITAPLRTRLVEGAEGSLVRLALRDEKTAWLPAGAAGGPSAGLADRRGWGGETRPYPNHRLPLRCPPFAAPEAPPPGPPQQPYPRSPPPTHVRAAPSALRPAS